MIVAALTLCVAGCGGRDTAGGASGGPPGPTAPEQPSTLTVVSPDVTDGGMLPARFTCDGAGARPALHWARPPAAARELVLLVTDPDAPGGTVVHWSVFGLAPSTRALGPGRLPAGAAQGANSFGHDGWGAPCPPRGGGRHRYVFAVYWLRTRSGLHPGADGAGVAAALQRHAGGRGELTATYERGG